MKAYDIRLMAYAIWLTHRNYNIRRNNMAHRHNFFLPIICFFLLSGFNLDNAIVPKDEILSGGPPKDGIPALLTPTFVPAGTAKFIRDKDQVIGVTINGESKAYPIKILNWHEAVNDTLGGKPIVVTY